MVCFIINEITIFASAETNRIHDCSQIHPDSLQRGFPHQKVLLDGWSTLSRDIVREKYKYQINDSAVNRECCKMCKSTQRKLQ